MSLPRLRVPVHLSNLLYLPCLNSPVRTSRCRRLPLLGARPNNLNTWVMLHSSCGRQFKARLEELVRSAASHPKMAALLEVVLEHFRDAAAATSGMHPGNATDGAGGAPGAAAPTVSRVIVFTNLRDSVASICGLLEQHAPLVTAKCVSGFKKHLAPLQHAHGIPAAGTGCTCSTQHLLRCHMQLVNSGLMRAVKHAALKIQCHCHCAGVTQ